MSEVHAADREHLVPISAKVPSELADAVSRLADAGDRSVSREVYRALRSHVERSGGSLAAQTRPNPAERGTPVDPAASVPQPAGEEP
jgi:predicted transcriptional regulator